MSARKKTHEEKVSKVQKRVEPSFNVGAKYVKAKPGPKIIKGPTAEAIIKDGLAIVGHEQADRIRDEGLLQLKSLQRAADALIEFHQQQLANVEQLRRRLT